MVATNTSPEPAQMNSNSAARTTVLQASPGTAQKNAAMIAQQLQCRHHLLDYSPLISQLRETDPASPVTHNPESSNLEIAIEGSLGGAFIAAVILFILIAVIKQRRRAKRQGHKRSHFPEQAAKIAIADQDVLAPLQERSTVRVVEMSSTLRSSCFRHSSVPEVLHEMSVGDHLLDPEPATPGIFAFWRLKRRPLSSRF
jgi:hypothetical protein